MKFFSSFSSFCCVVCPCRWYEAVVLRSAPSAALTIRYVIVTERQVFVTCYPHPDRLQVLLAINHITDLRPVVILSIYKYAQITTCLLFLRETSYCERLITVITLLFVFANKCRTLSINQSSTYYYYLWLFANKM